MGAAMAVSTRCADSCNPSMRRHSSSSWAYISPAGAVGVGWRVDSVGTDSWLWAPRRWSYSCWRSCLASKPTCWSLHFLGTGCCSALAGSWLCWCSNRKRRWRWQSCSSREGFGQGCPGTTRWSAGARQRELLWRTSFCCTIANASTDLHAPREQLHTLRYNKQRYPHARKGCLAAG